MKKGRYFSFNELETITKKFEEKVGEGAYGEVYKGVEDDGEEIAVKKLRPLQGLDDHAFDSEILNLSSIQHPNIVQLMGYCHESGRKFYPRRGQLVTVYVIERALCFEYVQGGSLHEHIFDDRCDLDWLTCYGIIKGTCEGLNHLHTAQGRPIYHGDLKPGNILLDTNMMPKIADLGLSTIVASTDTYQSQARDGTLGYVPPEYLDRGELSPKFDVFSLGVIIIRIMDGDAGNSRCHDMPRQQFIEHVTKNWKERLPSASKSSQEINMLQVNTCVDIALRCVEADPKKRPRIQDIIDEIKALEDKIRNQDNKNRVNSLDDLLHEVTAEPINVQLAVLQDITKNFSDERKIGQGGFGIVYKGVLQTGCVAVKKLLNCQTIEDEPFCREVTSLMGVRHKNVIRFLGYCANTDHKFIKMEGSGSRQKLIYSEIRERMLCFEYMSNGDLDSHLTDEMRGLEWHTRYQIIKGICEGLQYLHETNIVHMDLKPSNILLDDYMVPKITDFGISRYLDGVSRHVTKQCLGSLGYCAPEYLRGGEMSLKADIFSLGAIIRDIVSGRKQDIDNYNVLRRWRYRWNGSGKYPPLGYQQISKCIEISRSCMAENPKLRPYIWEIIIDQNEEENTNEQHVTNAVESMDDQISPYPWELLDIDPLELNFSFKPNKQIHSSIELNNERDDYIAFDIQKPSLLNYFVEPNKGIMPPHSRSSVTIALEASNRAPHAMLCKENFIVRCAIVDDGLTAANVSDDVFDTKLGKVVDEVMLTVAFT